jgi:hypothetical protein
MSNNCLEARNKGTMQVARMLKALLSNDLSGCSRYRQCKADWIYQACHSVAPPRLPRLERKEVLGVLVSVPF